MGERIAATTSAVDLYATILDGLGAQVPPDTHSRSLLPLLMDETDDHRDWALYGWWGSSFNVTDGRFTYHHPVSADVPAYCHSTEMLRPWGWVLPPEPHADAEAGEFLPYTDTPVWRYAAQPNPRHDEPLLFDLETDPGQTTNLAADDPGLARDYRELLERALDDLSVPENVHESLGLEA